MTPVGYIGAGGEVDNDGFLACPFHDSGPLPEITVWEAMLGGLYRRYTAQATCPDCGAIMTANDEWQDSAVDLLREKWNTRGK